MRKQFKYLLVIVIYLIILNCGNNSYRILKTPFKVIDHLSRKRIFTLYLPHESGRQRPLLVYFHGIMSKEFIKNPSLKNYTGSPVQETGLIQFCKKNKIILLVPEPAYKFKFQDYTATGWSPFDKEIPGIEKLIDLTIKNYNISPKQVYLAGISAGAVFINHLANRRPEFYNSILSHSQGYTDENKKLMMPSRHGPSFGVVFCYTKGDYKNIISISEKSHKIYLDLGYKSILMRNLPLMSHKWHNKSNRIFWNLLKKTGQY